MPRLIHLMQNHRKSQIVTVKAHGGPIDIQGISIATVDDQARIRKIETWFDPLEMFRQIAPDGIVTKEKIITQIDGNEASVSKNDSSQGEQDPSSSEEAANEKHGQGTAVIETPRPAVEDLNETKNLKSVEESADTAKVKFAVETDTAAERVQQPSTDQLNAPDQQFATEPSSSLQSEQKDVIASGTTTELAEISASDEPNHQVYGENLTTKSVPETNQSPTPTIHSKPEPLIQPLESGTSVITPSNDANDKNPQAELIPYLNDEDPRQQQQEEVDRSGQTAPPIVSIPSELEEAKPEQPSSDDIPSTLEERLRKLEARMARLEFMERFVVDSGESRNGAGAGAGTLESAAVVVATFDQVKKEGEDRKKEDTIQAKTDAHDVEDGEKEKSRTATRIIGNEYSPSAAAVAGAGCPFLNRG